MLENISRGWGKKRKALRRGHGPTISEMEFEEVILNFEGGNSSIYRALLRAGRFYEFWQSVLAGAWCP